MRMIERADGMKPDKGIGRLLLILLFFSGFCGMIYVIAWMQAFRYFLGPPLLSMISVLTIFLGGLALGSYLSGRFIDIRPDPLKIYGLLEGALGIYSFILPWLIHGSGPIYEVIYQNIRFPFPIAFHFRYILCASILLIPSILIGAIWPVTGRLLIQRTDHLGGTIGKIYGVNTLGGSIGVLTAGFLFLPNLGVNSTIYLGAGIDLIICICSLLLYKGVQPLQIAPEGALKEKKGRRGILKEEGRNRRMRLIILIGYALSGLAAALYLVIWLRILIIFLDSSLLALYWILSAFILGLALGSLSLARFADKGKDPLLILGFIEIIIGLSSLGIIPLLERYPLFIVPMIERFANSFLVLKLTGFSLLFFMMLIPTLLLGLSFPLVCRIFLDKIKAVGRSISAVLSITALGCLLGTLSGGIPLIIWMGIKKGGFVPMWSYIFIGCLFLSLSNSLSRKIKIAVFVLLAGSFILFTHFMPFWEMPLLKGDPYRHAYHQSGNLLQKGMIHIDTSKRKKETIFSKEGIIAAVSVIKGKEDISMLVNGKTGCSTIRDLPAQVLAGHIPLLLHKNPEEILLIGLGSGITLGSMEQYPVLEIDCVEISQGVIEGSGYFHEFNNNALKDPRLRVIIEDAWHHLMFTDKKYDVIIFQPLKALPGAVTGFFTMEFFQLCQKRLKPKGIAAIHLPVPDLNTGIFKSILFTWHRVFPFMNLWETNLGTDYLLIGSNQGLRWDYPLITDRFEKTEPASDLARINIKDPPLDLLTFFFMDNQGLAPICLPAKAFSDNGTRKAFFAPRLTYGETMVYPPEDMQQNRGMGLHNLLWNLQGFDAREIRIIKEKIDKAIEARRYLTKAYMDLIENESRDKVLEGLKEALRINPDDRKAIDLYNDILFASAIDYTDQKRFDLALWTLLEMIRVMPDNLKAHYFLGRTYYNMGLIDQAITAYKRVIESEPDDEEVQCQLGVAYLNSGWIDLSISRFERAIRINPDYAEPHFYLGVAYFKKDMVDQAIEEYNNAIVLEPSNADAHYNLGIAYMGIGMIDEAVSEWKEVIRIRPDDVNSRYNLAMTYYNHGDIDQSITQLEAVLKVKPDFSQARSLLQILYQMRTE